MTVPLLIAVAALVSAFLYSWRVGINRRRVVKAAIDAVRPALMALQGERGEALVASVLWYGAVDIAPEHLMIWVLLENELGSKLPPWFSIDGTDRNRTLAADLDPALLDQLRAMRHTVHETLRKHGWKAEEPRVGFEWNQRVTDGGGFLYFK